MTKVTVDIEQLHGAATSLSSATTSDEEKCNTLTRSANEVSVPTYALTLVPGYVEDLRNKSKTLDAKVDLVILVNSGNTGNAPESGSISYGVSGNDPGVKAAHPAEAATLAAQAIYRLPSLADENGLKGGTDAKVRGAEMAPHLERILETYMPSVTSAYGNSSSVQPTKDEDGDGVIDLRYTVTTPNGEQLPDSPWFSTAYLGHAIGLIGRDRQALLFLRQAVNKAEAEGVNPNMTDREFTTHATQWSTVDGAFANAVGTGAIEGAQAKDDYALAWIELGKSAASETAGAADAAGLNGHQDENSRVTLDDVEPEDMTDGVGTNPDGTTRLITQEEFDALDEADQRVARNSLNDLIGEPLGLSARVPSTTLNTEFNNQFTTRFS